MAPGPHPRLRKRSKKTVSGALRNRKYTPRGLFHPASCARLPLRTPHARPAILSILFRQRRDSWPTPNSSRTVFFSEHSYGVGSSPHWFCLHRNCHHSARPATPISCAPLVSHGFTSRISLYRGILWKRIGEFADGFAAAANRVFQGNGKQFPPFCLQLFLPRGRPLDACLPSHIPLWHRPWPLRSHFKPSRHAIAFREHRSRCEPLEFFLGNWGGLVSIPVRCSLAFARLSWLHCRSRRDRAHLFRAPSHSSYNNPFPHNETPRKAARSLASPFASCPCRPLALAFLFVCGGGNCPRRLGGRLPKTHARNGQLRLGIGASGFLPLPLDRPWARAFGSPASIAGGYLRGWIALRNGRRGNHRLLANTVAAPGRLGGGGIRVSATISSIRDLVRGDFSRGCELAQHTLFRRWGARWRRIALACRHHRSAYELLASGSHTAGGRHRSHGYALVARAPAVCGGLRVYPHLQMGVVRRTPVLCASDWTNLQSARYNLAHATGISRYASSFSG